MQKAVLPLLTLVVGVVIGTMVFGSSTSLPEIDEPEEAQDMTGVSPYAGQEAREIVSLSETDIAALAEGSGIAFGGMAKFAELNGYPGPRHVLELADDLELTDEQQTRTQELYDVMRSDAIVLGEEIIEAERQVDESFKRNTITSESLGEGIRDSARIYGELRDVHLQAHLTMVDILTEEQVAQYNELRGYEALTNPCENAPEGHDADLWRLHNGCE